MFFADEYTLSRSSVFKVLLGLFFSVALLYSLFVHQVFLSSEAFHRNQLNQQLQEEVKEIETEAKNGIAPVSELLSRKQETSSFFTYNIIPAINRQHGNLAYPAFENNLSETSLLLPRGSQLDIGIKPALLEAYRETVVPMMLTGVALPISLMFAGAAVFAITILRKLQRVNHAMNRVLCGEKQVKLPVSRNDDEFDIMAIHLNFMIEQMEKNEASLKSLTVGIAHDMRTPMSRLKLRLEQLLESPCHDNQQRDQLEACHDELEMLLTIFNSMLEITKLNSGQQFVDNKPVDIRTVANDVADFLAPLAETKNQQLSVREDQPCLINGDRSLLFRAIFNLVENSLKYTPDNGAIEIVIDSMGIVVADSGSGISDIDKAQVCKPMYRADKSRTTPGNGLGLALVEAVAHRHQAKLILRDNYPGLRARIYTTLYA